MSERLSEDPVSTRTTTVVGAEQGIGASGKVYSEYQWDVARGERRTISLLGRFENTPAGRDQRPRAHHPKTISHTGMADRSMT